MTALEPTADPAWVIAEDGNDLLRESAHASRFSIGNGFIGIRGGNAVNRGRRAVAPQHTYAAGLFDQVDGEGSIPALVPAADWRQVRIRLPREARLQNAGVVRERRMRWANSHWKAVGEQPSSLMPTPATWRRHQTTKIKLVP